MPGLALKTIVEETKKGDVEECQTDESALEESEIREPKYKPEPEPQIKKSKPTVKPDNDYLAPSLTAISTSTSGSGPNSGNWRPLRPASPNHKVRYDPYPSTRERKRDSPIFRSSTTRYRDLDRPWREQRVPDAAYIPSQSRVSYADIGDTAASSSRVSRLQGASRQVTEMSPRNYARIVKKLRAGEHHREVGAGTNEDPKIMWICEPNDNPDGRMEAVEALCREACKMKEVKKIWIRKEDHSTTRTFWASRTGHGDTQKAVSSCDPHLTVYMGNSLQYTYEGHIYVGYAGRSRIPSRLALDDDRKHIQPGDEEAVSLIDRTSLREAALRQGYL
ncbi:hypothetical protein BDV06DRAFT_223580 [Aspergillus oleicola]